MQCIQAGLASNLVKSSCMSHKKDIFVNTKKGIKNAEFYADWKFGEKVEIIFTPKKL
jgi:hypothetical protein